MREKRICLVADYIQQMGIVSMEELCERFTISMSTLRRDINILLSQHRVQKVYGGVAAVIKQELVPFENRNVINKSEKSSIAKKAAELITSNELIFIDSGTTTQDILKYLPLNITKLSVLTNNLDIINYIAEYRSDISLITLGNLYKSSTRSFVGSDTFNIIDKYNINKAFMAATAVSIENGLTNSDLQEYEIKKRIVDKAQQVYLLADSSKFDHSTLLTYADLSNIDGVVTTKQLSQKYQDYCLEHHTQLILC